MHPEFIPDSDASPAARAVTERQRPSAIVAGMYRVPRHRDTRRLSQPAGFSLAAFTSAVHRYEKQAMAARTRSGPKSAENSSKSMPAPRTRAAILSAIMLEIPSSSGERLFTVKGYARLAGLHIAADWSGRGRQARPQKNYAVGLEMLCPGGAYAWAPEIPSGERLADPMPSKCELVHNRPKRRWIFILPDKRRRRGPEKLLRYSKPGTQRPTSWMRLPRQGGQAFAARMIPNQI